MSWIKKQFKKFLSFFDFYWIQYEPKKFEEAFEEDKKKIKSDWEAVAGDYNTVLSDFRTAWSFPIKRRPIQRKNKK